MQNRGMLWVLERPQNDVRMTSERPQPCLKSGRVISWCIIPSFHSCIVEIKANHLYINAYIYNIPTNEKALRLEERLQNDFKTSLYLSFYTPQHGTMISRIWDKARDTRFFSDLIWYYIIILCYVRLWHNATYRVLRFYVVLCRFISIYVILCLLLISWHVISNYIMVDNIILDHIILYHIMLFTILSHNNI